jgi:FAD dependent oxidoreductase
MFQSIVHKTVKCSRLANSSNALRLRPFASGPGHDDEKPDKFNIKREHPLESKLTFYYKQYLFSNSPLPPGSMRILKNDMKTIKNFFSPQHWLDKPAPIIDPTDFVGKKLDDDRFQTHCDVLVIGGGGVGSSVAYWLKKTAREGLNVCVVEKDDTVRWHPAVNSCKF